MRQLIVRRGLVAFALGVMVIAVGGTASVVRRDDPHPALTLLCRAAANPAPTYGDALNRVMCSGWRARLPWEMRFPRCITLLTLYALVGRDGHSYRQAQNYAAASGDPSWCCPDLWRQMQAIDVPIPRRAYDECRSSGSWAMIAGRAAVQVPDGPRPDWGEQRPTCAGLIE